jgi:APA family basic amino acid/polyamine antiporter
MPWVIGIGGILGCLYLFYSLPVKTQVFFIVAQGIGVALYFTYGHGAAAKARAEGTAG